MLDSCKDIAKLHEIEKNIWFTGRLNREEIAKLMENSLAFVQHSIISSSGDSEGTPVAILEAGAAALPVIATYHGGIPDVVINNETGILIQEHDVHEMAKAMSTLIENKPLAKKMGEAGRDRIKKNFSMNRYISKLREIINSQKDE